MGCQKGRRSWKGLALLFLAAVLAVGVPVIISSPLRAQAAVTKNGWVNNNSNRYFYKNGTRVKSDWVWSGNSWYYFKSNGVMAKAEFITHKGKVYYLGDSGQMATGWLKLKNKWYYFNTSSGARVTGLATIGGKKYYIAQKSGQLIVNRIFIYRKNTYCAGPDGDFQTGFRETAGKKYYFTVSGAKKDGWHKIGRYWYLADANGAFKIGWQTVDGKRYYMIQSGTNKGVMLSGGVRKIGKNTYAFDKSGAMLYKVDDAPPAGGNGNSDGGGSQAGSGKTIKNYLLNAIQPVGKTLYVWGGGWQAPTTNYKGVYPGWRTWYNSQSGSYNYANYKDLSNNTRKKGLDCSGFVGWTTYQVMQKSSGGPSYVAEASTIASYYAGKGYGTLKRQSQLSQNGFKGQFKAGDVASRTGHTWIVMGQCADGSVVVVHSTPPCVQIAGTPTPSGSYSSQAIALAKKYMKKYYGSTVSKFGLGSATSYSYLSACNIMRWNNQTLSDPEGYRNKSADQVLADMFSK